MEIKDLLKKIRKIEIKSRHVSDHIMSGEYHTAFKGRGMSFSEVREYQYGDDVRNIDWNVTARSGKPHLKVFEEERELSIYFVVDISNSAFTSATIPSRREKIIELCATLAFAALKNNDQAGMYLFNEGIVEVLHPKKGKNHILHLIRTLLLAESTGTATKLENVLSHLSANNKRKSIVFIISDFLFSGYQEQLSILSKKHDVIGISIADKADLFFPAIGLIPVKDSESGGIQWLDAEDKKSIALLQSSYYTQKAYTETVFKKAKASLINIDVEEDFIKKLITFFKSKR